MNRLFLSSALALALAGFSGVFAAPTPQDVSNPALLGNLATQLSSKDIANLEAVLPAGAKPWLLVGGNCMCAFSIAAYLPPDSETKRLRRGRILTVWPPAGMFKGGMPSPNGSDSWKLADTSGTYAQLAVADGIFEQPQSLEELRGLFGVTGQFDDATLLGIVDYVRSNSRLAGPIEHVSATADNVVQVWIRISSPNGPKNLLRIRREGQSWIVLKESIVIQ